MLVSTRDLEMKMGRKEMQVGMIQAMLIIIIALFTVMVMWYCRGLAIA